MNTQFEIELNILRGIACLSCRDATRFVLSGICVDLKKDHTKVVATNGKCLAAYFIKGDNKEERQVNLPIFWLPYFQGKQCERAAFDCNESKFEVESGGKCFKGKLIEGNFPKWGEVVPSEKTVAVESFNLNLELAQDFVRCLKHICRTKAPSVVIRQHGDSKGPMSVLSPNDRNFYGVQMPIVVDTETIPDWVTK